MFIRTMVIGVLAFTAVISPYAQSPSPTSPKMSQNASQADGARLQASASLPFEVVSVDVKDSWAKTQIEVSAVAKAGLKDISAAQVRQYLQALYADKPQFESFMRVKRGRDKMDLALFEKTTGVSLKQFRFSHETSDRSEATHFYAMIYANQEEAKSVGNWIGRLSWTKAAGTAPEVEIREARLQEARQPASTRFGLSLEKRQSLYKEVLKIEHEASEESEAKYPSDVMKQADYEMKISKARKTALASKNKIALDQLKEVGVEAFEKGWPR